MKKVFVLILSGILSFLIWATVSSLCENIKINNIINDFINEATYLEDKSDDKNKYYIVKSKEKLDSKTYTVQNGRVYPGGPGDLILSQKAAIEIPVIHEGINFYVGGHAAMSAFCYEDDNYSFDENDTVEVTGFGSDISVTKVHKSFWNSGYYDVVIAVRVKTSLENRLKAFNRALSFYGEEYNYSFMFNKNKKKYCSDLMSASYEYVGIDLDYDNVATTVLDLMASPNVYVSYVSIIDNNNCKHTYLLVD